MFGQCQVSSGRRSEGEERNRYVRSQRNQFLTSEASLDHRLVPNAVAAISVENVEEAQELVGKTKLRQTPGGVGTLGSSARGQVAAELRPKGEASEKQKGASEGREAAGEPAGNPRRDRSEGGEKEAEESAPGTRSPSAGTGREGLGARPAVDAAVAQAGRSRTAV